MKKDIVKAILSEDYAKANNIFGSILAEKLEKEFEVKKKELVQENWSQRARSGFFDYISRGGMSQETIDSYKDPEKLANAQAWGQGLLALGALAAGIGILKGAAMIPSALKGMKQAKRFGKLGPNLKYIQKWFPNAKPGDVVLLAFESSSGSIPSHQYIKYEQVAIILAALGSKTLQHNEKQMIVNGIDQSQESFKQITAIAARAVERDGDIQKLADYQQSQQNEEVINEVGKGTDWESWGRNAGEILDVGSTGISSIQGGMRKVQSTMDADAKYAQAKREAEVKAKEAKERSEEEKEEKKERARQSKISEYIKALGNNNLDPDERMKVANNLEDMKQEGDYTIQLALQQYKSEIEPVDHLRTKIEEFATSQSSEGNRVRVQDQETNRRYAPDGMWLAITSKRNDVALGYMNRSAAAVLDAWFKESPTNINQWQKNMNSLASLDRLLSIAITHNPKAKPANKNYAEVPPRFINHRGEEIQG